MIESSLILAVRDSVSGQSPGQVPDREKTREETPDVMDRVPSMWNFALLTAGADGRDDFAVPVRADTSVNVDNR